LFVCFIGLQAVTLVLTKDTNIMQQLKKSIAAGELSGDDWPVSPYGHMLDQYTECWALATNLGNEKEPVFHRISETPFIGGQQEPWSPCGSLLANVQGIAPKVSFPYFHYWHGHQVYLRPLLSFMTLGNIRVLNALLLIGAVGALVTQMKAMFGCLAVPAVLIPLIIGTDILTAPTTTVQSLWWTCVMLSLAIIGWKIKIKPAMTPSTIAIVFCFGSITSFFDLLFSPAFAPTLIGFLALVVGFRTEQKTMIPIRNAAILVIVWFIGFSTSWASKWAFSTAVLGSDVVWPDLTDAFARRSLGVTRKVVNAQLFSATKKVFSFVPQTLLIVCILIAAGALIRPLAAGRLFSVEGGRWACLHLPLIVPVAWVELMRNHSVIHPYFAGRAFIFFAIIPLLASLWMIRGDEKECYGVSTRPASTTGKPNTVGSRFRKPSA
jgi:hypothetical protein